MLPRPGRPVRTCLPKKLNKVSKRRFASISRVITHWEIIFLDLPFSLLALKIVPDRKDSPSKPRLPLLLLCSQKALAGWLKS
jgi:hypothetical protein